MDHDHAWLLKNGIAGTWRPDGRLTYQTGWRRMLAISPGTTMCRQTVQKYCLQIRSVGLWLESWDLYRGVRCGQHFRIVILCLQVRWWKLRLEQCRRGGIREAHELCYPSAALCMLKAAWPTKHAKKIAVILHRFNAMAHMTSPDTKGGMASISQKCCALQSPECVMITFYATAICIREQLFKWIVQSYKLLGKRLPDFDTFLRNQLCHSTTFAVTDVVEGVPKSTSASLKFVVLSS